MKEFHARVDKGRVEKVVGGFGLGHRNERLIQFCREKGLVVTNTFFELPISDYILDITTN